jgi:hypothetical protein
MKRKKNIKQRKELKKQQGRRNEKYKEDYVHQDKQGNSITYPSIRSCEQKKYHPLF